MEMERPMTPEETKRQILARLQEDADVQRMREFVQHGRISTYEHCERVAELSWRIDRFFSLHSDPDVLLTGAMLHDFYLYDWHRADNGEHRLHGFRHAKTARRNAEEHFRIGGETGHVIDSHMWPLNPLRLPTTRLTTT